VCLRLVCVLALKSVLAYGAFACVWCVCLRLYSKAIIYETESNLHIFKVKYTCNIHVMQVLVHKHLGVLETPFQPNLLPWTGAAILGGASNCKLLHT
jgi:hypothetical protein